MLIFLATCLSKYIFRREHGRQVDGDATDCAPRYPGTDRLQGQCTLLGSLKHHINSIILIFNFVFVVNLQIDPNFTGSCRVYAAVARGPCVLPDGRQRQHHGGQEHIFRRDGRNI